MKRTITMLVTLFLFVVTLELTSALSGLREPTFITSQGEAYQVNHSCSLDHTTSKEVSMCSEEIRSVNQTSLLYNDTITECPRYSNHYPGYRHCTNRNDLPTNDQFLVKSMQVDVIPVNVSLFTIIVNWSWHDSDYRRTIGKLQGYELRITRGDSTVKCLCIREPGLRRIDLGLDRNFEYESNNLEMTVDLATFPFDGDWDRRDYSRSVTRDWPAICTGSPVCLFSLPGKPAILDAVSTIIQDSREVNLSWTKPSSYVNMYYIKLFNGTLNKTISVFVNGSNNVRISGLPLNAAWSVRIQGYSPCSGLASFYSHASDRVGCGEWSLVKNVTELVLPTSFTGSTLPFPTPPIISTHHHPYIFVTITLVVLACLFVSIVVVVISICFKKNGRKSSNTTIIFNSVESPTISVRQAFDNMPILERQAFENEPANVDVLVLYSLGTPTHEKVDIEKYIVGYLKMQHFKVISCNDHTEKTVMQWVEENARLARIIFIVCNKQFSLDWKMNRRPQLVNSLDMIVASAVGQNIIRKFATVLLKPGDEKNIPDNLYFKGMQSFVMGLHATSEEKAKFSGFIKFTTAMP